MTRTAKVAGMALFLAAVCCSRALGQALSATTLIVDLENVVDYQADISDPSKFASNPGVTPSTGNGTATGDFGLVTSLGDVRAVNGQPANGLYAGRTRVISATPTPAPGKAIADITRTAIREQVFEILKADGTPVGTIMSMGFSGGQPPPGAPSAERGNWAIVGGTGAFLGARGWVGGTGGAGRAASMAEDPANRRANGGTSLPFMLHVIPMSVPQIVTTANGPAVTHSDFSLVTSSKPAAAGEILSLFATSLGPTVPAVDPATSFPATPLAIVNSPVAVTVNGKSAEVLAAVGFPGSVDGYQVNFRLPADIAKGSATIQMSVAWIPSAAVSISVQ